MSERYNGWKNYETWNVALWIGNDEGLYAIARGYRRSGYRAFVEGLKELFEGSSSPLAWQTPDGVAWTDSGLDTDELDALLGEL